jgi:hypothetical protein
MTQSYPRLMRPLHFCKGQTDQRPFFAPSLVIQGLPIFVDT